MSNALMARRQDSVAATPGRALAPGPDRPVFFIGVPRSGTTIVFETFSAHENMAWFSNYFYRFPKHPELALISRLAFSNRLLGAKRQNGESRFRLPKPYPIECYPVWERYCGREFRFDYLLGRTASPIQREEVGRLVTDVTRYQGKRRFVAKLTGPARIHYLNSIFPNALFIHVIRDGRAVVNSLLKVGFWKQGGGYEKPWWTGGLTDGDMELYKRFGASPSVLAAVQWRRIILAAREEAARIDANRYMELRYEDVAREPVRALESLLHFAQLRPSAKVDDYLTRNARLKDMNFKFSHDLSGEEIDTLNVVIGDVNSSLGYH